jgi:hypothetical protein
MAGKTNPVAEEFTLADVSDTLAGHRLWAHYRKSFKK